MPEQSHATSFDPGQRTPPDVLFETPHWYALHTRGRHEKKVDGLFRQKGIESFLPVVAMVSQWKDRKKLVTRPMFPSYVFGCFALGALAQVLAIHGVAGVVGVRGRPVPIGAAEIESVRLLMHALAVAKTTPDHAALVREGSWVRVAGGPFDGVRGVVVERLGRRRVLVGIGAIGQALEVDLPLADLVPIPAPS